MAQVILKKQFGPQGNAKVTLGKSVVRVQMGPEVYELDRSAWNDERPAGEYNISLSKGLDKIVSIRPPAPGTHIVRFKGFGNRVADVPQPRIKRGGPRENRNGGRYIAPDKMTFSAHLEVVDGGQYDGLVILDNHTYGFEPEPGSPNATVAMEYLKDLERFEMFMRVQGIDLGELNIPYAPNVLPWLEDLLLKEGKPFMISTNQDGFVETRSPVPAHLMPKEKKSKKSKK